MRAMEVSIGAEVTFGEYAELDACTQHVTCCQVVQAEVYASARFWNSL